MCATFNPLVASSNLARPTKKLKGLAFALGFFHFQVWGKRGELNHISALAVLNSRRRNRQMFGRILGISIHHGAGLPPPKFLELVTACTCLTMPRSPGVAQIMKAQILDSCFFQCGMPRAVG